MAAPGGSVAVRSEGPLLGPGAEQQNEKGGIATAVVSTVAVGPVSEMRAPPPAPAPASVIQDEEEEEDDGYGLGVATPMSEVNGPTMTPATAASGGEPQQDSPAPAPLRRRGSSGVLSGLARLLPLGMMPRTSLRYKRHLSCADMDAFQGLAAEAAAVTEALALPQCVSAVAAAAAGDAPSVVDGKDPDGEPDEDDPRFGRRGAELLRLEGEWRRAQLQLQQEQGLLGGNKGREEAKAASPPPPPSPLSLLPQGSPSLGSPSRPKGTRIRRCASMPVGPIKTDGGRGLVVNFPGGGKFFYWQSGVATFLNRHFDLRHAKLVGASAGSLTATLMACDVDAHHATEVAVRILRKYGVYERPMGLVGVWGAVVKDWLDEILPDNAHELCSGRVHISVLCLPYRRHHVSEFASKQDLIDTCMASAHLPVVMDGKPFFLWRGWPCVDGSILAGRKDVPPHLREHEHVTFDYVEDEALRVANKQDFMALSDPDGLKMLVEMGYQFAERLTTSGLLPPTIQTLRKLDLSSIARELHLKEDKEQRPQYHQQGGPLSSPIQEGEDEDATSPLPSVGGIHGSPSSASSSASTTLLEVDITITQPNPALLAELGRRGVDGFLHGMYVPKGVSSGVSSRGASRASSVTGATEMESPLSSPASSLSEGTDARE